MLAHHVKCPSLNEKMSQIAIWCLGVLCMLISVCSGHIFRKRNFLHSWHLEQDIINLLDHILLYIEML